MNNKDMPAMPLSNSCTDLIGSNLEHANGLTKLEHASIEMMKAIIIGNGADITSLGIGASKDAIDSAKCLLAELEKDNA